MPFHRAPWAHQDAYARLPFDPARATASNLHAGSLTFLDLADTGRGVETLASYLDAVPAWLLARPAAVLIRWRDETGIEADVGVMRQRLDARGLDVPLGLVSFPLGDIPRIAWDGRAAPFGTDHDASLLNRARRVEIGSYLHWGGAVWRPEGYHYRFPSGRHARTYVRLADAFLDIHAGRVLATWLSRHLTPGETMAVIAESGTISPGSWNSGSHWTNCSRERRTPRNRNGTSCVAERRHPRARERRRETASVSPCR